MLSPVSSLPISSPTTSPREATAAAPSLAAALTTADPAVALSLAAISEVEGKLNMLLIGVREKMIDSLFAVIDSLSQALNMQQQAGETNVDYAQRLAIAINDLAPEQVPVVQQQLNAQGQTVPLALVARALQNPAGTEAAQVVAYLEVVKYKEKDLATQAVVASYGQNGGEEAEAAAPARTPAQGTTQAQTQTAAQGAAAAQAGAAAQPGAPMAAEPEAQATPVSLPSAEEPAEATNKPAQAAAAAVPARNSTTASPAPAAQGQATTAAQAAAATGVTVEQPASAQQSSQQPGQLAAANLPVNEPGIEEPQNPVSQASAGDQAASKAGSGASQAATPGSSAQMIASAQTPQVATVATPQQPVAIRSPNAAPAAQAPAGSAQALPAADTKAGNTVPVPAQVLLPDASDQIPTNMQAALKVVVAQLVSATGAELLQTMAEVAPVAEKVVAQALVADMLDSSELGTLPSPEDDIQQSRPTLQQTPASSSQATSITGNPTEELASVVALNRLLADATPAVPVAPQPLPLQAQLPLGVPFAVGQYLPAEDAVEEKEALYVDRVDAVGDEDEGEAGAGGRQRRDAEEEGAEEEPEARRGNPYGLAAEASEEIEPVGEAAARPLALPRPAPIEPFREPAVNLYQRMGGWD